MEVYKETLLLCAPTATGKLQSNRNGDAVYLRRERTSGSSESEYGREGIQSFLGPHCGVTKHASWEWSQECGAEQFQRQTAQKGEQMGAAIRSQRVSSTRDSRGGAIVIKMETLPGSTQHAQIPDRDTARTETTTHHPKTG